MTAIYSVTGRKWVNFSQPMFGARKLEWRSYKMAKVLTKFMIEKQLAYKQHISNHTSKESLTIKCATDDNELNPFNLHNM